MRKGQTEIIGLVVIVLLLVVIGTLFVVFSSKTETNPNQEIRESMEVNNFLSSIMQFTPCLEDEKRNSMLDIIKKCYSNEITDYCNEPCDSYVKNVADDILKNEIDKGTYVFRVIDPEKNDFLKVGNCTGSKVDVGRYPIQVGVSGVIVELKECR